MKKGKKMLGKRIGGSMEGFVEGFGFSALSSAFQGVVGGPGINSPYIITAVTVLLNIAVATILVLTLIYRDMYFLLVIILLVVTTFKSGFMLFGINSRQPVLEMGVAGKGGFAAVVVGACAEIISTSLMIAGFNQSKTGYIYTGGLSYTYEPLMNDFKRAFTCVTVLMLVLVVFLMVMPSANDDHTMISNIILGVGSLLMVLLSIVLLVAGVNFYEKAKGKQVYSSPPGGTAININTEPGDTKKNADSGSSNNGNTPPREPTSPPPDLGVDMENSDEYQCI